MAKARRARSHLFGHGFRLSGAGVALGAPGALVERRTEIVAQFADLLGVRVVSTSVVQSWDTTLSLERGYVLEVFPDSVQYEMWEAHLDIGLVVFSGGRSTFFPPASHGHSQAGGGDGISKS
jgi:hypothetical protein